MKHDPLFGLWISNQAMPLIVHDSNLGQETETSAMSKANKIKANLKNSPNYIAHRSRAARGLGVHAQSYQFIDMAGPPLYKTPEPRPACF